MPSIFRSRPKCVLNLTRCFEAKGAEGFRVLAVATRKVAIKPHYSREDEQAMTFRGFLVFSDPPKAGRETYDPRSRRARHRIKVISGDNRYVTAHLAEAVGLDPKSMLTGERSGKTQG